MSFRYAVNTYKEMVVIEANYSLYYVEALEGEMYRTLNAVIALLEKEDELNKDEIVVKVKGLFAECKEDAKEKLKEYKTGNMQSFQYIGRTVAEECTEGSKKGFGPLGTTSKKEISTLYANLSSFMKLEVKTIEKEILTSLKKEEKAEIIARIQEFIKVSKETQSDKQMEIFESFKESLYKELNKFI